MALPSLHGGSLEVMLTVSLTLWIFNYADYFERFSTEVFQILIHCFQDLI